MPAAVRIEGVLKAVAITFEEEVEDVATCFVPDILTCCLTTPLFNPLDFISIINVVVVI